MIQTDKKNFSVKASFSHFYYLGIHQLEKRQLVTCPGFAGYCSEAYPGGVCTVVCAFGRPNVPECQVSLHSLLNFRA